MRKAIVSIRKFAIFCHRWMGAAFCLLFSWWFFSGIFMMYWDYPSVGQSDRLERSPAMDASKIRISPEEAWARTGAGSRSPAGAQLEMLTDGPHTVSRRAPGDVADGAGAGAAGSTCICGRRHSSTGIPAGHAASDRRRMDRATRQYGSRE